MVKDKVEEMWNEVIKFNEKYFEGWRNRHPVFYSNAMAGEVGEICGGIKFVYGGGTHHKSVHKNDVGTECVDVFIYMILLMESLGMDFKKFRELFDIKMNVLEGRMSER